MPQISRGKFDRLQRTAAGFTTSELDGDGLRDPLLARPPPYASYPVLVHRLASLLHASFRPRLAASVVSPLRFAMTSLPSSCQRDFHPRTVEHARHTKQKGRFSATLESSCCMRVTALIRSQSPRLQEEVRGCTSNSCCGVPTPADA